MWSRGRGGKRRGSEREMRGSYGAVETKRKREMSGEDESGWKEREKIEIRRLRQKMGRADREKLPSSSETEMGRTEETEFKASAAERAAADPSHVRRAKVSLICSPRRRGGPSCDERER